MLCANQLCISRATRKLDFGKVCAGELPAVLLINNRLHLRSQRAGKVGEALRVRRPQYLSLAMRTRPDVVLREISDGLASRLLDQFGLHDFRVFGDASF